MRNYPANSPEAMARIVIAILLADGSLDVSEIERVDRRHLRDTIGISEADFERVLHEYCDDLDATGECSGGLQRKLDLDVFALLLSQITDDAIRLRLTSFIIDLISADGDICPHELAMTGCVMANWGAELAGLKSEKARTVNEA
jgi:uncharacterized tellurite resistance protein B-like protein